MNGLQGAALGLATSSNVPLSPHHSSGSPIGTRSSAGFGRRRAQDGTKLEQSPESVEYNVDERGDESRIGVKRACNECRQQKLRCDVVQEPFQRCSRCQRCNLDCRIDTNFKRIGKRKRNAEMEREIVELRNQVASQQASPSSVQPLPPFRIHQGLPASPSIPQVPSNLDHYMGSQEAVASLLDLKSGLDGGSFMKSPNGLTRITRRLEDIVLSSETVQDLFEIFFNCYHPYSPLLEPEKPSEHYFEACQLLFWTIIAVAARRYNHIPNFVLSLSGPLSRLLWVTIADVPQSYHVVKALCILCTWPLPISSTSADPTFMISGLMMQIAMQIGLHRPSHAQDFTKFKVELRDEELRDRIKTWAGCNVVAQRVATGYGQPAISMYDWTLSFSGPKEITGKLPEDMRARLRVEMFCNKVTKALYSNRSDPVGMVDYEDKSAFILFLAEEFEELKESLNPDISSINNLYLHAAGLHLRLFVFFDSPNKRRYNEDLLDLYYATRKFLRSAFDVETAGGKVIAYTTNYILQMIIAAAFTLLKLLNSFFAKTIDLDEGKALFTRTISTIREISVTNSDLPSRLAEVLAQLWRGGGAGSRITGPTSGSLDNSLQLKVRCRLSMSLVYDSVWRWREEFQAKGGSLESALKNPTNPDSAAESSASSVVEQSLPPSSLLGGGGGGGGGLHGSVITPGPDITFAESNYEVFDPLNWMLDGLVDFPYSFSGAGMEPHGLSLSIP